MDPDPELQLRQIAGASRLDLEMIQRDVRYLRNQINKRNEFLSNTLAAAVSGRERMEQIQRRMQENVRIPGDLVSISLSLIFYVLYVFVPHLLFTSCCSTGQSTIFIQAVLT